MPMSQRLREGRAGMGGRGGPSSSKSASASISSIGDDPDASKVPRWAFLKDKKRFAWALLSILKNNIVSAPIYYLFLAIEYAQMVVLYLIFALFFYYEQESSQASQSAFIQNLYTRVQSTLEYITTEISFQIVVVAVILVYDLVIILSVVYFASQFESPELAKRPNLHCKVISLLVKFKCRVVYTIEIILLAHIFKSNDSAGDSRLIIAYFGAVVCFLISGFIEFFLSIILNVRLRLIEDVPWCSQKTIFPGMKSIFKTSQGILLAISIPQASIIVLFIVSSLQVSLYIYFQPFHNKRVHYIHLFFLSIIFAEYFHLMVASFDTNGSSSAGPLAAATNGTVTEGETTSQEANGQGQLSDLVTVLLFFLSLLVPAFAQVLSLNWQERLQNKLLASSQTSMMKSEFEIEKALVLFAECFYKSSSGHNTGGSGNGTGFGILSGVQLNNENALNENNTPLNKQIVGLILYHRERCRDFKKGTCFCVQFDDSLQANRLIIEDAKKQREGGGTGRYSRRGQKGRRRNEEDKEESEGLQQNPEGQAIQGAEDFGSEASEPGNRNANGRRLLPPNWGGDVDRHSTEGSAKGNEKELDWQQEEQKQFMKGLLNPLFQAEHFISQSLMAQRKQQADFSSLLPEEVQAIIAKHNNELSILDFGSVKVQTVVNILYRIIRDCCEQNPKSLRLMMFKAYFELYIMRKKYLSHQTLTRMQGEEHLSWLNYTQFQLDQQYLVEKASIMYQTKEDQLIDVDRIIMQNYHYQHFHDLNEETAFQLNIFWAQLSNPKQIDIEKLFESGVRTSELIKLTKDKFQELIALGIDKRNSNLYHMYANFNLYVLNSNDLHGEYVAKMEQIQGMNRTLQENSYKDQLISDVDKSGFILVRGTYQEFGKILYANRKLCQMLGYTPEQINSGGKTINVIMPQLISEKHHTFLNIFRETGNPVFIQRQQQLFIKNANGYITPFKCYIKFHYDKQYGHVFCAIINTSRHFHPFKNKKKHGFGEVLTIMTDDLGTICEISPSVTQYFGIPIKFVQQNQMFLQDNVKIWHLLRGDAQQMIENQQAKEILTTLNPEFHADSDTGKPVFAARHCLQELMRIARKGRHGRGHGVYGGSDHGGLFGATKSPLDMIPPESFHVEVKVKMAKIRHKDILTVRYFFIEIPDSNLAEHNHLFQMPEQPSSIDLNNSAINGLMPIKRKSYRTGRVRHPNAHASRPSEFEDLDETHLNTSSHMPQQTRLGTQNQQNTTHMNDENDEHGRFTRRGHGGPLPIDDSSSGSDASSSTKVADLVEKEIDQLIRNDRRTPKILKRILWLVLFAFLSTTIIAAILMGLFVADSQQTKQHIGLVTQALQRGTYCSQVMNLLRSLLNHNLGYESDPLLLETQIWGGLQQAGVTDIDAFLSQLIIDRLDTLKDRQQSLELTAQRSGDRSISQLEISSLNSQGVREVQQQSPNVALNVLLSNIIDIVSNVGLLRSQTSRLNISFSDYYSFYNQVIRTQQAIPAAFQYRTVELQKQIFFVFENYVRVIDGFNAATADYYQAQGTDQLGPDAAQRFLILICISIGSLFIVLLLVSPVTFKIRRQKYQVLLFFLGLKEDVVAQCYAKSAKFEEQFSDETFLAAYEAEEEDRYTRQLMRKTRRQLAGGRQPAENADATRSRIEGATHLNESESESEGEGEGDDAEEFDFEDDYDDNSLKLDITQDGDLSKSMIMAEEDQPVILRAPIGMSQLDAPLQPKGARIGSQNTANIVRYEEIKLEPIQKQSSSSSNAMGVRKRMMRPRTATLDKQIPAASPFTAGGPLESNKRLKQKAVGFNRESLDGINELPDNYSDSIATEKRTVMASEQSLSLPKEPKKLGEPLSEEELEKQAQEEKRAQEDRELIQTKIRSISTKQQSSIFLVFLLFFLALTGYFVGIYMLSRDSLHSYKTAFKDIRTVHDRSICLSKLFFFAREDLLTAAEASLSEGGESAMQGYKSLSMDQLWRCMHLEQAFTELKRSGDSYLDSALTDIKRADSAQGLCSMVDQYAGPSTRVTKAICLAVQNSVFSKGLSLAHQDFIKSVLITLLDYFSRVTEFSTTVPKGAALSPRGDFILSKLRTPPFLEYLYSNELMLTAVNSRLADQVVRSFLAYIDRLESLQVGLFSALQIILFAVIAYFLCHMFNRMKKDMLSSHLMIAMLPKHLLSKNDQLSIRNFLVA